MASIMESSVFYIVAAIIIGLTVIASIVLSVMSFKWDVEWLQHNGKETSSFGFRWGLLVYCIAGFFYEAIFIVRLTVPIPAAIAAGISILMLALLVVPKCTLVYPIFKASLFPLPAPKKRPSPSSGSNLLIVFMQLLIGAITLVLLGAFGKAGVISIIASFPSATPGQLGEAVRDYNRVAVGYGVVIMVIGLVLLGIAIYAMGRPKDPELHRRQQNAPRFMIWAASLFAVSGIVWIALAGLGLAGVIDLSQHENTPDQSAEFVVSSILERVLDLAIFLVFVFVFKGDSELKSMAGTHPYTYFHPRSGISPWHTPATSHNDINDSHDLHTSQMIPPTDYATPSRGMRDDTRHQFGPSTYQEKVNYDRAPPSSQRQNAGYYAPAPTTYHRPSQYEQDEINRG